MEIVSNGLQPVGCVIMASGQATRFGSNKLLTDFRGKPLIYKALEITNTSLIAARVVVTRSPELADYCRGQGVEVLLHDLPGRNDTVRLGLEALLDDCPGLAGCMFLPGDQPLLRRASVEALVWSFLLNPALQKETERLIFRLGYQGPDDPFPLLGSPVLFGRAHFPALCALPEGKGGHYLVDQHPECVKPVCTPNREELLDADTPQELETLLTYPSAASS